MQLTAWPLVAGLALLAAVGVVLVPATWDRWRHPARGRSAAVLLAVALVLLASGAAVNTRAGFFPTLASLTSSNGAQVVVGRDGVAASLDAVPGTSADVAVAAAGRPAGHGLLVRVQLSGQGSGLSRPAAVYLPDAYFDPARAGVRFPVIEVLSGSPGNPPQTLDLLGLATALDRAATAQQMAPAVVVVPDTNGSAVLDRECVDAASGVLDDTYLTADLQAFLSAHFRVLPPGAGWGLLGSSTGGFCAVNLTLRHPDRYGAAASLSGYYRPLTDVTTGDLYGGSSALRDANDPSWRITHLPVPPVHLWLSAGTGEPGPLRDLQEFTGLLHSPVDATAVTTAGAGHNFAAWSAVLPQALGWLSARLPAGTADTGTLPGQTITHLPAPGADPPAVPVARARPVAGASTHR